MITTVNILVDIVLLAGLCAVTVVMIRAQGPLTVVVLSGIYSLSICALFAIMDAVDVALTEAAVGAGISTVLLLLVIRPQDEPEQRFAGPSPLALGVALAVGALLVFGTLDMPFYGDPSTPVHQHLAPRFLNESGTEIGVPNVVTSVLASYRGYDTLGEVVVIFAAGVAVLILLSGMRREPASSGDPDDFRALIGNPILKVVLIRIIPLVVLYALYVQFHGDYGPGGGFQAGVVLGAGVITFGLLTDSARMRQIVPEHWVRRGMALGVLVYGLTGVAAMLAGGEFLNYSVLAASQTAGQHLGILLIEFGVGLTVASTMISLYYSFNPAGSRDG